MQYKAESNRYEKMKYNYCGKSGLQLPLISLGMWHNFGKIDSIENARKMVTTAFDNGINHFDLANNYGPPAGSAEDTFGEILKKDLKTYRDELIISSKAGYLMWPGPYGDGGSRKYLISSLDQSLKRMNLDYVDIFYSHRWDPNTPLEETMGALDYIVKSGRALYVGISSYNPEQTKKAVAILKDLGTPCLIHQPSYSMINRNIENGLTEVLEEEKIGAIVFSALAQGMLTDKYIKGIPKNSRAAKEHGFLKKEQVTKELIEKIIKLNSIAKNRNQTMAQLAIAWVLRQSTVVSALIGASSAEQILEICNVQENLEISESEEIEINKILEM